MQSPPPQPCSHWAHAVIFALKDIRSKLIAGYDRTVPLLQTIQFAKPGLAQLGWLQSRHGSLVMSPLNITQPLDSIRYMVLFLMATIR